MMKTTRFSVGAAAKAMFGSNATAPAAAAPWRARRRVILTVMRSPSQEFGAGQQQRQARGAIIGAADHACGVRRQPIAERGWCEAAGSDALADAPCYLAGDLGARHQRSGRRLVGRGVAPTGGTARHP